jgi:methionyl-tRNA formyltransferase
MLKIILVTQDDPFYVPVFFRELVKRGIPEKFNILGVIIQPPLGKKSLKQLVRQMLDFYGFINFLAKGVRFVFYKILNIIAVKIFKGKFPGVFSTEHILLKKNFKIFHIKNINNPESLEYLRSLKPDIIFSIAASRVFKKNLLELPAIGCFNIHTAKLPKNRGMMPNFWSLYNYDKDPVSAITIHKMNEKLDDGDFLLQHNFELNPRESLEELIIRTKRMSAGVFLDALELLDRGDGELIKNDASEATYNTFPTSEDVKKFRKKGLKL